ncbi:hypothetical protein PhCBS80983_g01849 [Powellomyces hirtus]|uniref:HTH TFE/IIEalpha-type domain-containing protein n=1 Tax=Powellomyces hirtus TaxID=109895 RepID=A0A507EB57_9FUNG|nr:hypothetical protein PhCBS80983_g01849 [Powellomyces hirtus]
MASTTRSAKDAAAAKDILRKLVSLVARAYYEPKHVIVFDILLKVNSQRDEELAKALRVQSKELHKICGKLKLDGLLKVEARSELVGPVVEGKQQRKISRSYYYIDYKLFVDVVKWKIYKIGKMIEKEVQMQMANMPYKCPLCLKEYSALDFAMLHKTADMMPLCDICNIPIEVGSSGVDSTGVSEKYTKFMNESQPIVELLKQTDKLIIPEWVSDADTTGGDGSGASHEQHELAFSTEQGAAPANIVIEVEDKDEVNGDASHGAEANGAKAEADSLAQYYANLQAQALGQDTVSHKRPREDDEEDFQHGSKRTSPSTAAVAEDDSDEEEFEEI